MFTLNIILADNGSKANLSNECEIMTNDPVTFGMLFSILIHSMLLINVSFHNCFKFYYYSLVPKTPISLSSSNESSSQPHDQHGATISESRQQG